MPECGVRIDLQRLFGVRNTCGRIHLVFCRGDLQSGYDILRLVLNFCLELCDCRVAVAGVEEKQAGCVVNVRELRMLSVKPIQNWLCVFVLLLADEASGVTNSGNYIRLGSSGR